MSLRTRLFHIWFRLARPLTMGVRAVAFNGVGEVLLVRHTYIAGWHLPGGGVEPGEPAAEALSRELLEETDTVLTQPPVLRSVHFNNSSSNRDHVLVYECRNVVQNAEKPAGLEIAEARFFPVSDLPPDIADASRRRIDECISGTPADAYW